MISTLNFNVTYTYFFLFFCFIIKGTLAYGQVKLGVSVILQINKVQV